MSYSDRPAFPSASSADVPLFASTEAALAFGAACALVDFPTLVRTYFATQKAVAALQFEASRDPSDENMNAFSRVAFRLQTLREAIEQFLETSAAAPGAQGDPATRDAAKPPVHVSAAADSTLPAEACGS